MLRITFFILISVLLLTACDAILTGGKANSNLIKLNPIVIPQPPAPYTGPVKYCFGIEKGDSVKEDIKMNFLMDDMDSIRGKLIYSYANKPFMSGIVIGIKEGNLMEVLYTYTDSIGEQNRTVLTLKIEKDKLYQKKGAMVNDNGVWVLENPLRASLELFLIKNKCAD